MVVVVKVVMAKSKIVQENQCLIERAGVEFFSDLHFYSDIHDRLDFFPEVKERLLEKRLGTLLGEQEFGDSQKFGGYAVHFVLWIPLRLYFL